MDRKMKRSWSYIRFSKPIQLKGDSLRRQLEWGIDLCKRKDWVLDESLSLQDIGVSAFRGANADTGHLGDFLKAIKAGRVLPGDVLILESIDRLSRQGIHKGRKIIESILEAGVEIYTREPEAHYTIKSLEDIAVSITIMVYLERAFNESQTKSMRGTEYWKKRREGLEEKIPVHQHCPAWLKLSKDRQSFEQRPEAVKAIKLIYKLAGEGMGLNMITAHLNQDKVPPIGRTIRSKSWVRSYVGKLLHDKSVFGEYQPHTMKDGKRVPHGDPIKGYFPVIIEEDEWYKVRNCVSERGRKQKGRSGKNGGMMFRGLLIDARDRTPMQLTWTGSIHIPNAHCIISAGSKNGMPGSKKMPFPYEPIEESFLKLVRELKASDVVGEIKDVKQDEIASLSARLEEINNSIHQTQTKVLDAGGQIDTLLNLLTALDTQKKDVAHRLDTAKAEAATQQPTAAVFGETQTLATILAQTTGDERQILRSKIKARLRVLVEHMEIMVTDHQDNFRFAEMRIVFKSGAVRLLMWTWKRKGRGRGMIESGTMTVWPYVTAPDPIIIDESHESSD